MALTSYPFTNLTSGAANVKGAYAEIVAATPSASSRLHLEVRSTAVANLFFLIDLATGAAGAETVQVANIAINTDGEFISAAVLALDVDIPAGSRLAARCQSTSAAAPTVVVAVFLEDRPLGGLAGPVTYGTNTAASRGTQVDPGTTINTKGSYVQLSASTTARIDALALCLTLGVSGQTLGSFTLWQVDVATGAGGAETVVIADHIVQGSSPIDTVRPPIIRLPVSVPAGTRLAVRCQCNRNTAAERLLCVTLIGMQEPVTGGGEHAYTFVS